MSLDHDEAELNDLRILPCGSKLIVIYFLVFYLAHSIGAQVGLSYSVTHITHEDGQALGYTRDVIQDSTGLLWISSSKTGIHLYDGHKIKTLHPNTRDYHFALPHGVQLLQKDNYLSLIHI